MDDTRTVHFAAYQGLDFHVQLDKPLGQLLEIGDKVQLVAQSRSARVGGDALPYIFIFIENTRVSLRDRLVALLPFTFVRPEPSASASSVPRHPAMSTRIRSGRTIPKNDRSDHSRYDGPSGPWEARHDDAHVLDRRCGFAAAESSRSMVARLTSIILTELTSSRVIRTPVMSPCRYVIREPVSRLASSPLRRSII